MNVIQISQRFNTKKKCYAYLEKLRWGGEPSCSHCGSSSVTKRKNEYRYHCNACNSNFSVLTGTIFEDTRMEITKWFYLIALMLNARKGLSAKQLERDLGVTYKTAWYSAMRVRCAMIEPVNKLYDVVEMDEVYIGGKPRKGGYKHKKLADNVAAFANLTLTPEEQEGTFLKKNKRGRGADKIKVVGVVQRGKNSRVYTKVMGSVTSRDLLAVLRKYVMEDQSVVITDQFSSYRKFDDVVPHLTINHSKEYSRSGINTNTIEGFWSIVKNGIRGQYHVLSKRYLPFYLAEFSYKYNRKNKKNVFEETIRNALCDEKCAIHYKPKKDVRKIAYPRNKKRSCAINLN